MNLAYSLRQTFSSNGTAVPVASCTTLHALSMRDVCFRRRTRVDTTVVFPAGIGICYALLILVALIRRRQQRKAVPLHAKMMEIHFSLKEGDTIIGVMDRKKTMRFYSGNNAMDEKSYE